jgi:hypothetical protein
MSYPFGDVIILAQPELKPSFVIGRNLYHDLHMGAFRESGSN